MRVACVHQSMRKDIRTCSGPLISLEQGGSPRVCRESPGVATSSRWWQLSPLRVASGAAHARAGEPERTGMWLLAQVPRHPERRFCGRLGPRTGWTHCEGEGSWRVALRVPASPRGPECVAVTQVEQFGFSPGVVDPGGGLHGGTTGTSPEGTWAAWLCLEGPPCGGRCWLY